MMQVGTPSPVDPNQVTSKPRQMPSGGGFDPAAMGADVNAGQAQNDPQANTPEDPFSDPAAGPDDTAGDSALPADSAAPAPDDTAGDSSNAGAAPDTDANDDDTSDDDDGDTEDDNPSTGQGVPSASFTAAVLPRLADIALDAWAANPALSPRQAMLIAHDTLATQIRVTKASAYQYDPTMWAHRVGPTHPSRVPEWIDKGVSWLSQMMGKPENSPLYQGHRVPKGAPAGHPGNPVYRDPKKATPREVYEHRNALHPLRQSRFEEWLSLMGHEVKQQMAPHTPPTPGAPQGPSGHGGPTVPPPPHPPAQPAAPQGQQHSQPYQQPKTWGEWARHQMDQFGSDAVKSLWHLRHSAEPYRPNQRPATHEDVGQDWHQQWGEEPQVPEHREPARPVPNLDDLQSRLRPPGAPKFVPDPNHPFPTEERGNGLADRLVDARRGSGGAEERFYHAWKHRATHPERWAQWAPHAQEDQ